MNFAMYIFYIIINLIYSYITADYDLDAIQLKNGSFLVISESGLYTLDQTFQILYYNEEMYLDELDSFNTEIKQFPNEDKSSIFIAIMPNDYIINSDGKIFHTNIVDVDLEKYTYSLIPFNHLKDVFYYIKITTTDNNEIKLTNYSYNSTDKTLKSEDFYFNYTYGNMFNCITCQLIKYSNKSVISCFFPISINNENFINCAVFNSEKNFEVIQTSQLKIESISCPIESEVMTTDRQKVLIVFLTEEEKSLFYAGYDIYINNFTYGYLIKNTSINDFHISYFKETEEFIVSYSFKNILNTQSEYCYSIYSFDKNFNYEFLGIVGDKLLGNSCCKINLGLDFFYSYRVSQLIFFSSVAQKYCFISKLYSQEIISLFIINKEIKIVNPTELKSSDSPPEFICENYSINNNTNCTNNLSDINEFKILSENNFIEKCTNELNYIRSNFSCENYNYKTFEFSFNCSEKYPYEIVETHKCVEYCDEISLSIGKCKLNYYNYNINITEKIKNTDSYEVFNSQSDIISTENENRDIKTYSTDKIIESSIKESEYRDIKTYSTDKIIESSIIESEYRDIKTYSTDKIIETSIIESNNNIISDTALITHSIDFASDSQNIDPTIIKIETEQKLYDLLNTILNEKIDNNIFIENIQNIFSDGSINNILDKIADGDKDITLSNNETIIQITSTNNQRNNKNHNISTINLGACEGTLKKTYNIANNKSLLIIKIDSFIFGLKIPVIQYEVYHPDNKSKLNLSLCNNKVEINIPVSINENNLYKYEQDSDFYNDRCFINASENGKDIPLDYRRKKFINNNMFLCEPDCNYMGYDYKTKNSKCECELKKEISLFNIKIDTQRLYDKFTGLTSSNIDIIKCYYLLFKKENLKYNIGFYIILFIIILFFICGLFFIFKGYDLLCQKINIIISITKKTSNILNNTSRISKNENKRNNKGKKRKGKKKLNKKNNPPIKKVKNNNKKKRNNELNINNESKSIQKLKSKNNKSLIKNINSKKSRKKKSTKKRKINKLITDVPYSKKKSLNNNSKRYLNDYEINSLEYHNALKYDRRPYIDYYCSFLKIGNLFLFSFIQNNDYNSKVIKICLFFFSFGLYYTVNALFFTDSTMNKIFEDNGEYDFIYQIPKILYSNLICTVINLIVRFLSLSEKDILKIKIIRKNEILEKKVENIKRCLKIKFVFYYIISFLFLFIFWFYISCFCVVYKNTQIYLIKDTLISFSLSLLYPLGFYLLPAMLRQFALRNRKRQCIYKMSLLLQSF